MPTLDIENATQVASYQAQVTPRDYHYMLYGFHYERARLMQYLVHADSARRSYYEHMLHYHAEMLGFHAHHMRLEQEPAFLAKRLGAPLLGEELLLG